MYLNKFQGFAIEYFNESRKEANGNILIIHCHQSANQTRVFIKIIIISQNDFPHFWGTSSPCMFQLLCSSKHDTIDQYIPHNLSHKIFKPWLI